MEKGYYKLRFKDFPEKNTIGYCDGSSNFPFQVIGSDELFQENEFEEFTFLFSEVD